MNFGSYCDSHKQGSIAEHVPGNESHPSGDQCGTSLSLQFKPLMHHSGFPDGGLRLPGIDGHAVIDCVHACLQASIIKRADVSEERRQTASESDENIINNVKKVI